MTINLTVPQNMQELRPRITVVGVGGAGLYKPCCLLVISHYKDIFKDVCKN